MGPATLLAREGRADDQVGDDDEVPELDQVGRHPEMAVIILDLLPEQADPVERALEPLGGSDDSDIIPHEAADLLPIVVDDDLLVRIGDPAFVPAADRRHGPETAPVRIDM